MSKIVKIDQNFAFLRSISVSDEDKDQNFPVLT